jgi:diguanylate cyclase (GGDEF)-like protein/PAS domain S-box-containing protein
VQQITRTLKVLLIEDSLTDAILLERVFQRMNETKLDLTRVEFLQEALKKIDRDWYDIILLDLSLPDSWGLESLKKIQNITTKIPIIVLTGTDNDEIAIAALREGAQDYLIKDNSINSEVFTRLLKRSINHAIERKQVMEQLRHSEALYRGVIEDQTEFICRFLPNGNISFVNQAFSRYLTQTPTELLTCNFFFLIASEDLPLVTLSLSSLDWENPHAIIEFRGHLPQKLGWQQWSIRAIFRGLEIIEYQAVGQDISDRKQAETERVRLIASLHESQEKFRVVTNSAPVLIWMTDVKGKPIFVNQFWLEFIGKSLEQALIEDWIINVHAEDRQNCQNTYRHALQNREYFALEYRFLNYQGQYSWIFTTGVPRFDEKGQFAGFVCSGIDISKRKKAEELLAQQAKRNYILAEITKHIHESLELATILQTTTEAVNNFLLAEKITISKVELSEKLQILSESKALNLQEHNNGLLPSLNRDFWQVGDNLTRLEAGEIIVLDNLDREQKPNSQQIVLPRQILDRQTELHCSIIVVPIMVEKKLWGIFGVEQCYEPRAWKMEEIELLEQITRQLAIAIKQAELYHTIEESNKKLKELTVIDSLTGIANRRKFDEYLESEWLRLAREKSPLSLILCDIDYFKLYNDTYGHQFGDRCLQQVAQAIKKTVKRPADLTARYGGEELAVILPNTTPEGAAKVAENIRQQIQNLKIPHSKSTVDSYVTLSIGVAGCIPEHGLPTEDLLTQADRNLYKAKETGRNRVIDYS